MKKTIPPQLYILPFDHRATFVKSLFGWSDPLSPQHAKEVKKYKFFVWESFLKVYDKMADPAPLALLVDEQFGARILRQAKRLGVQTILTTEKSGQTAYDFEYGKHFGRHLKNFGPRYAKALVRYNPTEKKINKEQLPRLKKLADFCLQERIGFLFELLVPATEAQMKKYKTKKRYDRALRPTLTAQALKEIRAAGIEADIWKMEPMHTAPEWKKIISVLRRGNEKEVKIVILGRDATKPEVRASFKLGVRFDEIIGFAVGRTIFYRPLEQFHKGKISARHLVQKMADEYESYIKYWERLKGIHRS